jgi:hypothetical protein
MSALVSGSSKKVMSSRFGGASGNGLAAMTASSSSTVRTITGTGLPMWRSSVVSSAAFTAAAFFVLVKTTLPLWM